MPLQMLAGLSDNTANVKTRREGYVVSDGPTGNEELRHQKALSRITRMAAANMTDIPITDSAHQFSFDRGPQEVPILILSYTGLVVLCGATQLYGDRIPSLSGAGRSYLLKSCCGHYVVFCAQLLLSFAHE